MSKIPFYLNRIGGVAREDGLKAATRETQKIIKRITSSVYYDNVQNEPEVIWGDWEVCIILDACRPDILLELIDEYECLPQSIPTITSVGSTSTEWIEATFDTEYREYINETAYVTGNPYTDKYPRLNDLAFLDEVWRYTWDIDYGTQPPRPLTDRAITVWSEQTPARLLVHYMQPHFPSIPDPLNSGMKLETFGEEWPDRIWDRLEAGDLSVDRVWQAYRENCRYVLDEVELLLHNIDASRVIITADHGNAFGEWGYYGHPNGIPIPALREVPWVETTATDEQTHTPNTYESGKQIDTTVSDRLSALGYRDE